MAGLSTIPIRTNNKAEGLQSRRGRWQTWPLEKTRSKPYVVGGQVTYTLTVTNRTTGLLSRWRRSRWRTPCRGGSVDRLDSLDGAWDCTPKTGETSQDHMHARQGPVHAMSKPTSSR